MSIKSSIEMGRGHVSLATDQSKLEAGLAAASAKLKSWGTSVMAMGAGLAAGASAIIAPFLQGLSVLSDFGQEAVSAMRMTGMAFEEMDTLMDGMRVSAEQFVPATAKMSEFLHEAANSGSEAAQSLAAMGLSLDSLQGVGRAEQMMRIANALASMGDEGRRLQRKVFGRQGLALNIQGGEAGIRERAERADRLNPETEADVALAKAYNEEMRDMKMAIQGVWMAVGRVAAPLMIEFSKFLTEIIVRVRQWITENRYLLDILFRVVDKVVLLGGAIVVLGGAIYAAGYAFTFMKAMIMAIYVGLGIKATALGIAKVAVIAYSAVVSACSFVIGLFTGATWGSIAAMAAFVVGAAVVAGVGYLLFSNWGSFVEYMSVWTPILERFGATAMQVFRGIGDAIVEGNWALAFQVALAGIKLVWTQGINFLKGGWDDFTFILANVFLDVVDKISVAFRRMINGVIGALNRVIAAYNRVRGPLPAVSSLDLVDENAGVAWNQQVRNTMAADRARAEAARIAAEQEAQGNLGKLTGRAAYERNLSEFQKIMDAAALAKKRDDGSGKGSIGGEKFKVFGGFSAGAIFGALGQGVGPMERIVRQNEEARRQREQHLERLDDVLDILPDLGVRIA